MRKRRSKRKISARLKKKTRPSGAKGRRGHAKGGGARRQGIRQLADRRRGVQRRDARYTLNSDFEFLYELRDLILKPSPAEKARLIESIAKLGRIKLAIVAGVFMNRESPDPSIADLFIVGDDINPRRLRLFLKSLEAEVGKEIKFAVMDKEEFRYRLGMFDRFIRVLLEGPHEKIINKLGI